MKQGWTNTARSYILYRKKRQELRETKEYIYGIDDELDLSMNAIKTLIRLKKSNIKLKWTNNIKWFTERGKIAYIKIKRANFGWSFFMSITKR